MGGSSLPSDSATPASVPDEKAGNWSTFANVVNSFFGSGVLGLPFAFKMAGSAAGVVTLVSIACMARYCMDLLLRCRMLVMERSKELCTGSYPDIGYFAFGVVGRTGVEMLLVFTQFGFCCVYMIFLGSNLNSMFPDIPSTTFVCFAVVMLGLIAWLKSLKFLAPFSVLAETCTIVGLLIVNYFAARNIIKDLDRHEIEVKYLDPTHYFIFIGIATATFEGIALIIPIQQSMKTPKDFGTILNRAMSCIATFFICSGLTSYYGFGEDTQSIITLNMPHNGVADLVKLILCVAIFFTYPIQIFPVITIMEAKLLNVGKDSFDLKQKILRSTIVASTGAVAILVPHFGEVIGLIGSIGGTCLAYTVPALFYITLFREHMSQQSVIAHSCIAVGGLVLGILAAVTVVMFGED